MKRLAMAVLAVLMLTAASWAQGRLSRNPGTDDVERPKRNGVTTTTTGSVVSTVMTGKPMKLIGSAASLEDIYVPAEDINVDTKYRVYTSVSVNVPADPSRTYLYTCSGAAMFWAQQPSASPLVFAGVMLVRFETPFVDGGFFNSFDIPERVREFDVSTRRVSHMPIPTGCGMVDEAQLVLFFTSTDGGGLSNGDARALAQQTIRGPFKLTMGANVRMRSVPDFDFMEPSLQVWSD